MGSPEQRGDLFTASLTSKIDISATDRPASPDSGEKKRRNPFLDRVKSTGAGSKITPPASGPAANARTVVPNRATSSTETNRVEPILVADTNSTATSNDTGAEKKTADTPAPETVTAVAEPTVAEPTVAVTAGDSGPKVNGSNHSPNSVGTTKPDAELPVAADAAVKSQPEATAEAQTVPQDQVQAPAATTEIAAADSTSDQPDRPDVKKLQPQEPAEPLAASEDQPVGSSETRTNGTEATAATEEQNTGTSPEPEQDKGVSRPNLANPIESELEKLLSEMHGNQK